MTVFKFHIVLFITIVISSCSNLLTWHLDKGIHKKPIENEKIDTISSMNEIPVINMNIKSNILWSTSVNSAPDGNTGYLRIEKINNTIYTVDNDGMLSALSTEDGDILWQVPTNHDVSSGISIVNNKACIGTINAKLLCYELPNLASNKHIPLVSNIQNIASFSEYEADININLITELASPILSINNLFLLKLDNDDLYLVDPVNQDIIWKSESRNISLRTKGSSMPLIHEDNVFIARDNGSIASYNKVNGALNWFTISSSRSGRNDLESQRDAEMDIRVEGDKLYYGHFQGNLTSLDKNSGKIIWSSPFSIASNISLTSNSIIGSTTNNTLISLDKTSGFLNWKQEHADTITEPFIIDNIAMVVTTSGLLVGHDLENGTRIFEKDIGFDINHKTQFITNKNKVYFQSENGKIVCLQITI